MRTLLYTLSALFYTGALLVAGMALSVPGESPPPLAFHASAPAPADDGGVERSLERLAREQAASRALVRELHDTIASLQTELERDRLAKESLETLARQRAEGQQDVDELRTAVASLQEELDRDRLAKESLETLARQRAEGQQDVDELRTAAASLQEELDRDRLAKESLETLARQRAEGQQDVDELRTAAAAPAAEGAKEREEMPGTAPDDEGAAGSRVIAILGGGLFPPGQGAPSPGLERAVRRVLPDIVASPLHEISVEGHTDSLPIGSSLHGQLADNLALSLLRAETVALLLELEGVDGKRIAVTGHGDSKPLAPNDTEEGRAQNRRVEIWLRPPAAAAGQGGREPAEN